MKPKPKPAADSAHDVLHHLQHPLDVFFSPASVAVIGATEAPGSVGRTILWNLVSNPFGGTVFPVNPKRRSVLGIKAYPRIANVPETCDLALIVTPAPTVPGIVRECVDARVKGAIIISAGFKERGEPGAELERQVLQEASRGKMRVIGPNCLGVMSPCTGLNATFATTMALQGNVAFVSQSGALCTAVLDWSLRELVGFSAFISIGSMVDVGWGDLIDYLGDDPRTRSIILYMESIGNARAFLSAAREVALTKPIIVIKAGRTEAAAKAASSHTGALTGSDDVLDAAFRRCGVLRVDTIADLFHMAEVLAKQPRPAGPRLTIVTNAGGPGVLAADALLVNGGKLAELSAETVRSLDQILPAHWSHNNPIDILGDALPDRYAQAVEIVAQDPSSDGLLVILTPQAMTDPTITADRVSKLPHPAGAGRKPILASWMGGAQSAAGVEILTRANIPTFYYPDAAAHAFAYMWRYSDSLRGLYETPGLAAGPDETPPDTAAAAKIIQRAREAGRTLLTEFESKQVLSAYGIPTVATRVAESAEAAANCARELGYPVVLKLHSETVTHKAQAGGVRLNLSDESAVRRAFDEIESAVREKAGLPAGASAQAGLPARHHAGRAQAGLEHFLGVTVQPMVSSRGFELILGCSTDAQFGPVLVFGLGGQLVEVFRDRALALPPLNTTLARRMMERTRVFSALSSGAAPVDLAALEQLMVRFSQLVVEQRAVKEIDVNPLLASPRPVGTSPAGLLALDARLILHDPSLREDQFPPLPIRPYPAQYVAPWTMKDGTPVTLRPIRPEDEPLMVRFHQRLSEESVYRRYFQALGLAQRTAHERLTRICFIDYDRQMALVAERNEPETGAREILGVGRLSKIPGTDSAEFALLIVDQVQRKGLGTELLRQLLQIARSERIRHIRAEILAENYPMQQLCERVGFHLRPSAEHTVVEAEIEL